MLQLPVGLCCGHCREEEQDIFLISVLDISDRSMGGIVNTLSDRMRLPKLLTGPNNEPDS